MARPLEDGRTMVACLACRALQRSEEYFDGLPLRRRALYDCPKERTTGVIPFGTSQLSRQRSDEGSAAWGVSEDMNPTADG